MSKHIVPTEEGLACINSFIDRVYSGDKKPFLWKAALNYFLCVKAKECTFVHLYRLIRKYVSDQKRCFRYVARIKRGMENTQDGGGFYKD